MAKMPVAGTLSTAWSGTSMYWAVPSNTVAGSPLTNVVTSGLP